MPAAVIAAATVALALAAFLAAARWSLTILFATIVLVPDSLGMPVAVTSQLTVHRVVLIAVLLRIAWRSGTGRLPGSVWRPTSISLALSAYLLIAVLVGVAAAQPATSTPDALIDALVLLEQLGVLIAVTALVRELDRPVDALPPLVGVLVLSAFIGAIEYATGASWGHFLFSHLPSQQGSAASQPLGIRAGQVRVRAGADYPLGFSWTCAALLPALVVVAAARRRAIPAAVVALGLVLAAIYWSGTRSTLIGVAVALVFVGLTAGTRRVGVFTLGVVLAGAIAFAAIPAFSAHFSIAVDPGSVAVREQRLPVVLGAVAAHPITGLGLSGLELIGLQGVDASYLLTYGETGVVGLAALGATVVVALLAVGRGLRAGERIQRATAAATFAGALALIVSALAFDMFALPGVADVLWVLVAIGVVNAEVARGPERLLRPAPVIVAAGAVAAVVGGIVALAVGPRASQTYDFTVLPGAADVVPYDPVVPANTLIKTACAAFRAQAPRLGVGVDCRNLYAGYGVGQVRVEAGSTAELAPAADRLAAGGRSWGVVNLRLLPVTPPELARPTGTRTLPLSLAEFALLLATFAPLLPRERRMRGVPPLDSPLPAVSGAVSQPRVPAAP